VKYYRNGQLELEGKLKKGYRTGIWQIYNEKGELIEEVKYDDRGKPVNNN
jgi:antitoxin component YwqK of YwqJK toxin-antitoxin module